MPATQSPAAAAPRTIHLPIEIVGDEGRGPMSPHRAEPLLAIIVKSPVAMFAQLAQLDTAAAVLAAGGAAGGLGWLLGGPDRVGLVYVAALAILVDLAAGGLRAAADPRTHFSFPRLYAGIVGKLLRCLLVPVGALADWTMRLAMPGAASTLAEVMPFTLACLVALIGTELVSTTGNIRYVMRIPAALDRALDALQEGNTTPRPAAPSAEEQP
jgi:hypothetical protein